MKTSNPLVFAEVAIATLAIGGVWVVSVSGCATPRSSIGEDPKEHGYCAGKPPSEVTDTKKGERWVKKTCRPTKNKGRCLPSYNQLCISVQRLALADNTFEKKQQDDGGGPGKRMTFLLENYVMPVLGTYSDLWRTAIENDVNFSSWLAAASGTVRAEGGGMMKSNLEGIQKAIKTMAKGERREILIDMYSITENLVGLTKNPTGSLRDFNKKIRAKKTSFDELKSKLGFTEKPANQSKKDADTSPQTPDAKTEKQSEDQTDPEKSDDETNGYEGKTHDE